MKTEINITNKTKFFVLYWGQKVIHHEDYGDKGCINVGAGMIQVIDDGYYLHLKPLSKISDEDAIEVWDLCHFDGGNKSKLTIEEVIRQGKNIASAFEYSRSGWMVGLRSVLDIINFLRSKGYVLPWMELSVEEMVEVGWIKLL